MRTDDDRIEFLQRAIEVDNGKTGVTQDAKNMIKILKSPYSKSSDDELQNAYTATQKAYVRTFTDICLNKIKERQ